MANPGSKVTVAPSESGWRLDRFLGDRFSASRKAARDLIDQGAVRIDGRRAKKGDHLVAGQAVQIEQEPVRPEALAPAPQPEIALGVLYEDADLLALDKPAGMPSHPLRLGEIGTLANALVARFPECAQASRQTREGGLCHRLDTGTSGIILAARSRETWLSVREKFRGGEVTKSYLALVEGSPTLDQGVIDAPLMQHGRRSIIDAGGRSARTEWSVVERFAASKRTLLRVVMRTGRMHQVRAHLAYADLPIVGDTLYKGPPDSDRVGHFLHAEKITLPHPRTGTALSLESPLPADRAAQIDELRRTG